MKKIIIPLFFSFIFLPLFAQQDNSPKNLASTLISNTSQKLNIGGYASVDFTKPLDSDIRNNASLDVSRMIISMGYRFSDKTQFLTEVEFEHVKELYVEQAFLNHSFNDLLNFRAGLMLIPMGIINEYHEPTTFNGVARPMLDRVVVPTTWREIGAGFTGRVQDLGLKYQVYLFNGFNGYDSDGNAKLSGSGFLRSGRQKGAKSYMSSPNFSAKIDYYGIMGLKLGLASYIGETQSALYNNLDPMDPAMLARADSSVVGISMIGFDARYSLKGFHLRGQWIYSKQSNTQAYNALSGKDVGSAVSGYYVEGSYNLLKTTGSNHQLIPFLRYEHYDTHFAVDQSITPKDQYSINEVVFGIGWKPAEGAIFKIDSRMRKSKADTSYKTYINAGIGIWF